MPHLCGFRKETLPGIVQSEPFRLSGITGWHFRSLQQSMSARAGRLGAIPFEECLRSAADPNRVGEQAEALRAAVPLIDQYPAVGQDPARP
jgi:hypothetical protein